jgi:hypothetical protein
MLHSTATPLVPPLAVEAQEERLLALAALGRRIRVGLVGCSDKKRDGTHPARDLYTGGFFRRALPIAEAICDETWVLSARFGLVGLTREVPWYDQKLPSRRAERASWGASVLASLAAAYPGLPLELVFLAGGPYVEGVTGLDQRTGHWVSFNADHFLDGLWTYERPLRGLDRKGRWAWFDAHRVDASPRLPSAPGEAPHPGVVG